MAGAADTVIMTKPDVAAAAKRQRLERVLALLPDEIATAFGLATQQASALAALDGRIERKP